MKCPILLIITVTQCFTDTGLSAAECYGQKTIFTTDAARHREIKKNRIWSRDYHRVPNPHLYTKFLKIGRFFVEIWRFYDLQYGGRPPS